MTPKKHKTSVSCQGIFDKSLRFCPQLVPVSFAAVFPNKNKKANKKGSNSLSFFKGIET